MRRSAKKLPVLPFAPAIRWKLFYPVPRAGQMAGWGRSESYRRAEAGDMPIVHLTERLIGVPKKQWDRMIANASEG
jgi:hypothetical protein